MQFNSARLWRTRYQFNAMGFDDRVRAGELAIAVLSSTAPNPEVDDLQIYDNQVIQYVDTDSGEALAECHRYMDTRGSRAGELGASGRPDPKWLLVGDEEWNISHRDDEGPCQDCAVCRHRAQGVR